MTAYSRFPTLSNQNASQIKASLKPERLSSQNDGISAPVRTFARGDLLDHVDNAAPKLGVGNAGEGTG